MMNDYSYQDGFYSEGWHEASRKFLSIALGRGNLRWATSARTSFDIPYVLIGNGPNKVVINSGVSGIEGYFGSAAQLQFLTDMVPTLSKKLLRKYSIILIHVINGWGMTHSMRETMEPKGDLTVDDINKDFINVMWGQRPEKKEYRGSLVDLNQNFGIDLDRPQMPETEMTMRIYDEIIQNAQSLMSFGLRTGRGQFNRTTGIATSGLYVAHPSQHPSIQKFKEVFGSSVRIIPNENAAKSPTLSGNLPYYLENHYADKKIPIYAADLYIGTGSGTARSDVTRHTYMEKARCQWKDWGIIDYKAEKKLRESWYPKNPIWRQSALNNSKVFFHSLEQYLERTK